MQLEINKPSTVYVRFPQELPRLFLIDSVTNEGVDGYYFRYLDKTPRIKFNIPDSGTYITNVPVEVVKVVSIEIPDHTPELPPPDRDRFKPITEWYNPDMDKQTSTPIRIYTEPGIIEYGNRFRNYIMPIQKFLFLHETGHFFYSGEEECDFYALVNFVRLGYNQSTAYYALTNILKRTPANVERVKTILNNIQKVRQ